MYGTNITRKMESGRAHMVQIDMSYVCIRWDPNPREEDASDVAIRYRAIAGF